MADSVKCQKCNGLGYVERIDVMKAKTVKEKCVECEGSGRNIDRENCIRMLEIQCQTKVLQAVKEGKVIASLILWFFPFFSKDKKVMMAKTAKGMIPYYRVSIVKMNTVSKQRKKGVMSGLVAQLKANPFVLQIDTNIKDSTADGIRFLKKRGFVCMENNLLAWRRPINANNGMLE